MRFQFTERATRPIPEINLKDWKRSFPGGHSPGDTATSVKSAWYCHILVGLWDGTLTDDKSKMKWTNSWTTTLFIPQKGFLRRPEWRTAVRRSNWVVSDSEHSRNFLDYLRGDKKVFLAPGRCGRSNWEVKSVQGQFLLIGFAIWNQ